MVDSTITGLPATSSGKTTDVYVIVDTTDTSQAPSGTDKKLTGAQLLTFVNAGSGHLNFIGSWNATTNTPTLTSGTGTNGNIYTVSVAGTTNLDGINSWAIGDWAVFDGISNTWVKVLGSFTGALLAANNLSDVASASTSRTNLGLGTAAVDNTGNTVIAVSGALEQNSPVITHTGTNYTYLSTERGETVLRANSGTTMGDTLPVASATFPLGWFMWVINNDATANLVITPTTSTINGASSLTLAAGGATRIVSDGTNYWAVVGSSSSGGVTSFNTRTGAVTLTSLDVTTALTYTPLAPANNLSDVASASTSRTNLGLGTAAVENTGNTVIDVSGALEVNSPANAQSGTSYTYLTTDRGKTVVRSNSGTGMTDTLPQATSTFGNGWFTWVKNNDATASIVITPTTSTINGAATYTIPAGFEARISSDGTNYEASLASSLTGVTSFNTRTGAVTLTSSDVTTALTYTPLAPANNLSDLTSASTARTNLGLGNVAVDSTGNTVVAISGLLEQASPHNTQITGSYTYVSTDRGKTVIRSNSGTAMTDTLPQATGSFGDGWFTWIYNSDSVANDTITPTTSTINGAATLVLAHGAMTRISSDGTNYEALVVASTGSGVISFNTRTGIVTLTSADVTTALGYFPLNPANNLSDVSSASTSRTNLGLGTSAVDNTGNTVVAVGGNLEQNSPNNTQTTTSYTYLSADRAKTVLRSNAGTAMTDTLPNATGSFGAGWFVWIKNTDATAAITITPTTATINGGATYSIPAGQMARIISDGTNYWASISPASSSYPPDGTSIVVGSGTLEQASAVNIQPGSTYTYALADRGQTVIRSDNAVMSDSLPLFINGWFTDVLSSSTGSVAGSITITPVSGKINGATTYVISSGCGARIVSDGTNYWATCYPTSYTTNTALGVNAFASYASGSGAGVAIGFNAMNAATGGNNAVAIGYQALSTPTGSSSSTAVGFQSMQNATTASSNNVALGANSLRFSAGSNNIGIGVGALTSTATTLTGTQNIAIGTNAGTAMTTGVGNTLIGYLALTSAATLSSTVAIGFQSMNAATTAATFNTAIGYNTLPVSAGADNTAVGYESGQAMTSGADNTLVGYTAGLRISTGASNTAVGSAALAGPNTLSNATAIGYQAMTAATIAATFNTSVGYQALQNSAAANCTAMGYAALGSGSSMSGADNTAIGYNTGVAMGAGASNTLIGSGAGVAITSGSSNTLVGYQASATANTLANAVAIGYKAMNAATTAATFNTAVGYEALQTSQAADNTAVGYLALGNATLTGADNTCVGYEAGQSMTSGNQNVIIGSTAGSAFTSNAANIIIGYGATATAGANSNNVVIGTSATAGAFSGSICLGTGATAAASNQLTLGSSGTALGTQTTIGANGGATALTALPLGYLKVSLNGNLVIIPYYNH